MRTSKTSAGFLMLMFLGSIAPIPAAGQIVLEDFATRRMSHDGSTYLFRIYTGEDPNQIDQGISGGIWTITGDTNNGTGCYTGCGIYWDINLYPYDTFPQSWAQGWIKSGTFSSSVNRLQYKFKCTLASGATSIPAQANGSSAWDIGTYVKPHNNTSDPAYQGQHYYHGHYLDVYSNHWIISEINPQPNHMVGAPGEPAFDPEWSTPTQGTAVHYMDGLTRFYFDTQASSNLSGAAWAKAVCSFKDFQFRTVTGEPDRDVYTVSGTYTGTAFEVGFDTQPNVAKTFNIRYSRSSLHTNGFTSGTDGGTVSSTNSDYVGAKWISPAMALGTGLYVGIQPQGQTTFTEVFIPPMDVVAPANPCDINQDGVVNSTDVTLAMNAALGTGTCVADLDSDGKCTVIDLQRVTNASTGLGCRTGQ